MTTVSSIEGSIQFCIKVILKEAREETRLVKQIFYVMLSMYTNNPINLAINAPTGLGKNYIIQKVAELFPKEDVIFLAGLTEKALFHRHGILVTKNEDTGNYEPLAPMLEILDSEIEQKKGDIKEIEKEKKQLVENARKLIELGHKTLVILDTPSPGLFGAIMSLLSHDNYEVEYEFTDKDMSSGIKTRTNILRGWPVVIFAQAVDYSNYKRWSEVQRRFIITNPNMGSEKIDAAIDLTADKFGLPDFAYQSEVVNDNDKQTAKDTINEIKGGLLVLTKQGKPGKNNVYIPFRKSLQKSLDRDKASDMTVSYRLFSFLSLLPQINFYARPKIHLTNPTDPMFIQTIPLAIFDDLKESIFLMEYADGARPYILEWYNKVFLPTFSAKVWPDSKPKRIRKDEEITISENLIAVTTKQLSDATEDIQKKVVSSKHILEDYLEPLLNQGYVDRADSELDRRSNIYYPVITGIKKLFDSGQSNNYPHGFKISVTDPSIFPSKEYLNFEIRRVLNYSIQNRLFTKIIDHEKKEVSVEELLEQYYSKSEEYFELKENI